MRLDLTQLSACHPAAPTGITALRGITLSIASGEHVAVIGPSGAGKTTLLHVLACAIAPLSGQLRIDEHNTASLPSATLHRLRGRLVLAPQVPPLPPRQRVVTAVSAALLPHMGLWAALKNLFSASHAAAAHAALAAFDCGDKLFERVDRLSGGERQRVGLARCVLAASAGHARLLLVDEPLSALDPSRAAQSIAALTQAATTYGATLVCSLHQVDTALAHFPRIVGLRGGEQVFDLPASAVTPAVLAALYGDAANELTESAPAMDTPHAAPSPAVMHCR